MPITVEHQPPAAVIGRAAYYAGRGQYEQAEAERRRQDAYRKAQLLLQERGQTLDAQLSAMRLQAQQDAQREGFRQTVALEGLRAGYGREEDWRRADEAEKQRAWQQDQEKLRWERGEEERRREAETHRALMRRAQAERINALSPAGRTKVLGLMAEKRAVMEDDTISPDQKAQAIAGIDRNLEGVFDADIPMGDQRSIEEAVAQDVVRDGALLISRDPKGGYTYREDPLVVEREKKKTADAQRIRDETAAEEKRKRAERAEHQKAVRQLHKDRADFIRDYMKANAEAYRDRPDDLLKKAMETAQTVLPDIPPLETPSAIPARGWSLREHREYFDEARRQMAAVAGTQPGATTQPTGPTTQPTGPTTQPTGPTTRLTGPTTRPAAAQPQVPLSTIVLTAAPPAAAPTWIEEATRDLQQPPVAPPATARAGPLDQLPRPPITGLVLGGPEERTPESRVGGDVAVPRQDLAWWTAAVTRAADDKVTVERIYEKAIRDQKDLKEWEDDWKRLSAADKKRVGDAFKRLGVLEYVIRRDKLADNQ